MTKVTKHEQMWGEVCNIVNPRIKWFWLTFGDGEWLQTRPEALGQKNRWTNEKSSLLRGEGWVESIEASPKVILLANLGALDYTDRKKKEEDQRTGEGAPRGEHPCHSNHKRSVQSLKKPLG
jgi:hypothetical protein